MTTAPPSTRRSSEPPPTTLSVLRQRDYGLYWVGQAISMTGTWMQVLAQGWIVVGFSTSAFTLGMLNFASSFPMMVLSLFGGVVADRMEKRRILLVTQVVLMLIAFAVAGLIATHTLQLWHLFVAAVIGGIAAAYDMPASQALTPDLVEPRQIPKAIALNQSSFHGSRVLGPALAGLCIARMGLVSAYVANGISFIAVIISLLLIHPRPVSAHAPKGSPLDAMREGFAYVRQRRRLLVLMGLTFLTSLLVFPNMAVMMPLYVKQVIHADASGFGLLMGGSGTGALLGSMLLLTIPPQRRAMALGLGMAGTTAALFLLGLSHSLPLSVGALFVNSMSMSTMMGTSSTITQEVVPGHLRGRVMSLNGLMFVGIMPIASLAMAAIADLISLRYELFLCSALYGVFAVVLWTMYARSPEIHDYSESERSAVKAPKR